jgi:tetratricopeptide (TPR) repeat protein
LSVLFTYMQKDMQERQRNSAIVVFFAIVLAITDLANAQTPDASLLAGCASLKKGDLPKAIESLSVAIVRNNADERIFVYRGQAFLGLRDYENAIRDFTEANDIVAGVADIWLARTHALSGDEDKALSFLSSHLESGFRLPEDSIRKDPAFRNMQASQGWDSLWEMNWYSPEEKAAAEAVYYIRKGLPEKAVTLLDAEIGRSNSPAGLYMLRGEANYDAGNYAAAIADYTSALDLQKANTKKKYPSQEISQSTNQQINKSANQQINNSFMGVGGGLQDLQALRGKAYLKAGRFKDAVNDLTRELRENPVSFPAYLLRAEANAGMKSYDAAIKDVQTYLKYFDDDLQAVYQCGEYHYLAGDYINALKYFNRNLKEDPGSSLNYKARGKTYLKSATYRYAISDLSMSLDLNPDDAETWMYLGVAKIQSGDKENGCSDLEKARQMGNTEVLKYIVESCR